MSGFLVLEKNKLPIPLSKFLVLPRIFGLALSKLITHLKIFSPSIASRFEGKREMVGFHFSNGGRKCIRKILHQYQSGKVCRVF